MRAAADACDAATTRRPLRGIGVGVKDIIATAELPTTMGSPIFAGHRPAADAACIARLRAAGAFVFGKTVTTPFAFMDPGKTRNPWDPAHTPGGSSSGSAAAVAAGHVNAAIGTQTNGSVVRPAAYCGVVGFKPTLDVIPFAGINVFSPTFDTVGTFTRSVADAARLAPRWRNPARSPPSITPLARRPRLAYIGDFPWTQLDCHADAVVEAAATTLRTHTDVVPVDIPAPWRDANVVMRTIMLYEAAQAMSPLQARERARLMPALNQALDEGRTIGADRYAAAMARRDEAIAFFTEWLAPYDAVLAPSAPGSRALRHRHDRRSVVLHAVVAARLSGLNLPVGLAGRLPMGLQLAAPQRRDDALLAVAAWCEARLPFRGIADADLRRSAAS